MSKPSKPATASAAAGTLEWNEEGGFGRIVGAPPSAPDTFPAEYPADPLAVGASIGALSARSALNVARVHFVRQHWKGPIFEFRPASRHFTDSMGAAATSSTKVDPFGGIWPAIAFWDTLSCLRRPERLLHHARRWAFLSTPIFANEGDCLLSEWLRPEEHFLYWTEAGLEAWMTREGFSLVAKTDIDSRLGHTAVMSFAFKRNAQLPSMREET
jgi:hypothetical protein